MRCPLVVAAALCFAAMAAAQSTPKAVQQVEARRNHLRAMGVLDRQPQAPLGEADVQRGLADLGAALRCDDGYVVSEAVADLSNRRYVAFPPEAILELLLPWLKARETEPQRINAQGFVLDYVGRQYGVKAKAALPDVLRIVTDVKQPTSVRGEAVQAAARIAPADEAVVGAFIEALNNPEPANTSGVHDRIAELLGDMGKIAWPAKPALRKLCKRDPWFEDYAFVALGKLAMDDPPRPLADYLHRLGEVDRLDLEEAAAAFLHVQELCHPGSKMEPPHLTGQEPAYVDIARVLHNLDAKRAEQARPVLLKMVKERPGSDIFVRAALAALAAIGPGSSPEAIRVLVGVVERRPLGTMYVVRQEACAVLGLLEPTDKAAVPILAGGLASLLKEQPHHDWVSSRDVAQVIARFGKDAKPATPALIAVLEGFKNPPQFPPYEEVTACAEALAAAGGDAPGGRAIVLHLLDRDAPLLKKAGPNAAGLEATLLQSLGKMGVPAAGPEREAALDRIRGGLGSDQAFLFAVGAKVVAHGGSAFTAKEARTLVPLLVRGLPGGVAFKNALTGSRWPLRFSGDDEVYLGAPGMAVRALGALGTAARDALPALEALAAQPLVSVKGTYMAEPPLNHAIREARKAVAKIK
jgi:hypothetical protein